MKILRVIASMDPASGGPCQGIRNTISAMKPLHIENEVVCLDAPDSEFISNDSFITHALGPAKSPWGYSKELLPWLLENMPRFDAIIAHGMWLYSSYAVMKAAKELKANGKEVKWYLMPHGMLDPYFQKAEERRLKAIRNRIYWSLIEEKVVRHADALLFTCQQELLLARTTFRIYNPRAEWNVGYGIQSPPERTPEMEQGFREKIGLTHDEPYLLFLSRIHLKKGVDMLLRAYATVSDRSKQLPKLVIAGPGMNESFGDDLKTIIKSNPSLQNRVLFPGMVNGNDKWGAFYGADAFILPSHQENFGIAVAEALACSCPVLISDQVNIWREISEGLAGIVDADTVEGTEQLLSNWIEKTAEQKNAMRKAASETYVKNFTISSNINLLINKLFGEKALHQ